MYELLEQGNSDHKHIFLSALLETLSAARLRADQAYAGPMQRMYQRIVSSTYTVFIQIVAVATINFAPSSVRLLIEGSYYLFRMRAMIDTAACMRYVYIYTYVCRATPTR